MNVYGRLEDEPIPTWTGNQDNSGGGEVREEFETGYPVQLPFFRILIWSSLAAFVSVVLPVLIGVTSPEQSQDFYIGWAMHQGGEIYTDYFGTSGLLYYLLQYLAQGSILFVIFNWIAFIGAGIYLFYSAFVLTGQEKKSLEILPIFYVLAGSLSFGGGYAIVTALPFLLFSLYFAIVYMVNPTQDSGFVRIGIGLALSLFLAPLMTILFSVFLFLSLFVFNIVRGRFSHGIYQFLSSGLGFSLFFYPIGYYTVYKGSFGNAISQILYPIYSLNFIWNYELLDNLLFYGLLAIGLGALSFIFLSLFRSKPLAQYILSIFSLLGLLVVLALAIFLTEPIHGSRLVSFLPFISVMVLTTIRERDVDNSSRLTRYADVSSMWSRYLTRNGYLPILAVAYLLLAPFVSRYVLHIEQYQERTRIETTIKEQTQATDRIYIWDDLTNGYKTSERLAASQLLSPKLYTGLDVNRSKLVNDLRDNQPKVIVVNTKTALWTEVEQLLAESYQPVQSEFKDFKLYKLK